MIWSLLPSAVIWLGIYQLKSVWWTYGLYHLICLLPAIIWGKHFWLPTLTRPRGAQVAVIAASAIIFSIGAVGAYEFAGHKVMSDAIASRFFESLSLNTKTLTLFGFYAVLVNPIFEELFWRGVLYSALQNAKPRWQLFPVVWSSFAYALLHYWIFRLVLYPIASEIGTLALAGFGALLAIAYQRTKSIIIPVLIHGLITDLACVALMLDFFRRQTAF